MDNAPMRVAVHLGLHKTATTTLQQCVFPCLRGVRFIEPTRSAAGPVIYALGVQDPIYFASRQARAVFESVFSREDVNLISSEGLSGSLFASIGKRDLDHRHSILENLQRTLPEARILLVLRRQDQYARSVYRQYIRQGGVLDPAAFFGLGRQRAKAHFPQDRFRYREYVEALLERFPAGVHVSVFEEFVESPGPFLERICAFLGASAPESWQLRRTNRTRLGSTGLEVSRRLNRLFRSPLNPGGLIPGIPLRRRGGGWWMVSPTALLQDYWPGDGRVADDSRLGRICRAILEEQAENNRALAGLLKRDLGRYGYF